MRRGARELFGVLELFARDGRHPVSDVLAESAGDFTAFRRYPDDGVGGGTDRCAWYYHAHDPPDARGWDENGHFHCFAFTELLRPGAAPVALPPDPDFERGGLVHLAGLCVDADGVPRRLFSLNRWASEEWLYPAGDVVPLVERFRVVNDTRLALTSRWLAATLTLLQPQISWLLHERDAVLEARRRIDPIGFSEDPSIEVASTVEFDLDQHLKALDRAAAV